MINPSEISIKAEGGWTYSDACSVIKELRQVGVECGVTAGGVWILFDLERQGVAVVQIVKSHKGAFCTRTMMEGLVLESAQRVYRENAIARLEKLWSEN